MTLCPIHQVELTPPDDSDWRGKLLVCPVKGCQEHEMIKQEEQTKRRQMKLPGLDPGRQSRVISISEAQLVAQAAQWGALKGYEVLLVGQKVQYPRCPACRRAVRRIVCPTCQDDFAPELVSQSTTGTPDTFWGRPEWNNWWKAIEAKEDEHAPVRVEQQRLVSLGLSELAWTLEMFQAILRGK